MLDKFWKSPCRLIAGLTARGRVS